MQKMRKDTKKFIISCRVSDREMRVLHERAKQSGLSITLLLRQSLDLQAQDFGHRRSAGN